MTKQQLRAKYKEERNLLSSSDQEQNSAAIVRELIKFPWATIKFLHVFLPIKKMNEPNIYPFINYVKNYRSNMALVIGRSNNLDFSMCHFLFTEEVSLVENRWGIMEPNSGEEIKETELDAVLVPLLVADNYGNRVGYGKGFYDRFLMRCKPSCLKIGVSFFEPVQHITDVGSFDIPLDYLITPTGLKKFI
ncbi:5-formyltetrahydrofolate cyclo-ligase [Sphingobacterium sp. UT-1RO-CII-1]|uniref:5-formyltetrahydrofolate cyclo-ligase n=1 Tax=Sphingobacterium sp. UT-1RO-CII-1 TaxID=2995225 RepID=UPI00227BA13E|nr:5-formyltetrahydrofolate cyclo-ligase [Sphingobacterium sp. UT-1RO-CII-1]MCY4781010.1 5-formyltetrahydrofolate cyclo-ligase [Sphingobacterium sp. UT-1RO-CII-1]